MSNPNILMRSILMLVFIFPLLSGCVGYSRGYFGKSSCQYGTPTTYVSPIGVPAPAVAAIYIDQDGNELFGAYDQAEDLTGTLWNRVCLTPPNHMGGGTCPTGYCPYTTAQGNRMCIPHTMPCP